MRSREEWQEGNWAVLSPSPIWGAPGKEHRLGEPSREKGQGPQHWWGQGPDGLPDGLGTVSATVSLQTLLTELSPDQDFPPCCHLLSLCPPHCHPPHSTALLSLGLCTPCATSYHSPGCTVPTATSLGTGVVPCPVPPPPRETPAASPASPVSLPSLVTEPALPSVPPAHGAGSEHPAVTSHAGAQAGYTPLTPPLQHSLRTPTLLWLHTQPLTGACSSS